VEYVPVFRCFWRDRDVYSQSVCLCVFGWGLRHAIDASIWHRHLQQSNPPSIFFPLLPLTLPLMTSRTAANWVLGRKSEWKREMDWESVHYGIISGDTQTMWLLPAHCANIAVRSRPTLYLTDASSYCAASFKPWLHVKQTKNVQETIYKRFCVSVHM